MNTSTRLLRKNHKNNKDLPVGWNTTDELINALLCDSSFSLKLESEKEKIPSYGIQDIKRIFFTNKSWQLTKIGCSFLQRSYIWYKIELDNKDQITGKILINLSHILKSPWHIKNNILLVWNKSSYFEFALFDNDIKRYVDFYIPSNQF